MPKLPVIKSSQLVKVLEKVGFTKHRHHATSHLVMVHSDKRRCIVPIHSGKDIPCGTLKAILKDTEITIGELTNLL